MVGDGWWKVGWFFCSFRFYFEFICGWLLMLMLGVVFVVVVVGMSTFEKSC